MSNQNRLISDAFTHHKKFTKTIKLELKPYGRTLDTINERHLVDEDLAMQAEAKLLYPYLDRYIVSAVDAALEKMNYDFADLKATIEFAGPNDKDSTKKKDELIQAFAKAVADTIRANTGKGTSTSLSFQSDMLETAIPAYYSSIGDDETAEKFCHLRGRKPLFARILTSRQTAVNISVPKRMAENLSIYISNLPVFTRLLTDHPELTGEYADDMTTASTLDGYLLFMTSQGISRYNELISGRWIDSEDGQQRIKGLNEISNELNIAIASRDADTAKYRKAKALHKAILVPDAKRMASEMITGNDELIDVLTGMSSDWQNDFDAVTDMLGEDDAAELSVKGNIIPKLSYVLYSDTGRLPELLEVKYGKPGEKKRDVNARINAGTYTVAELNELSPGLKDMIYATACRLTDAIAATCGDVAEIAEARIPDIRAKKEKVEAIHKYCESLTDFIRFAKLVNAGADMDNGSDFASAYGEAVEQLGLYTKVHNRMRNYFTMKIKKEAAEVPVCFGVPAKFKASWYNPDYKPFSADYHTIVRMDNMFYLLTLTGGTKPIKEFPAESGDTVEVYHVNKLNSAFQCIPATAFTKGLKAYFDSDCGISTYVLGKQAKMKQDVVCTREVYNIYKSGLAKKDTVAKGIQTEEQYRENLRKLLMYYNTVINNYSMFANYDFSQVSDVSKYKDLNEYFNDVQTCGMAMHWMPVDRQFILDLVDSGKALMFLVTNMNMYHSQEKWTSYARIFHAIFSDENMTNTNICLNSSPLITFRKAVLPAKVAHPKGSQLIDRRTKTGDYIDESIRYELFHYYNGRLNFELLSTEAKELVQTDAVGHHDSPTDIIRFKRYTEDKFLVTFSYNMNCLVAHDTTAVLDDAFADSYNGNTLCIMRGSEHLLTYVVYEKDGGVIEADNIDRFDCTDYAAKLKYMTLKRRKDHRQWTSDTTVEEIKTAYLKKAVSLIAAKAVEYDAKIIIENVTPGTRSKMSAIDNQVYGQLEDMLSAKLGSYCVAGTPEGKPGSATNPVQLSYANDPGYDKWHRGILEKVAGGRIDGMDPDSGFINAFDYSGINSCVRMRKFLHNFNSICCNGTVATFSFNYRNFDNYGNYGQHEWTITVSGGRSVYEPENHEHKWYDDLGKSLYEAVVFCGAVGADGKVDVDKLSDAAAVFLFRAFCSAARGYVIRTIHGKNTAYYVSPVTGNTYYNDPAGSTVEMARAGLLYDRQRFYDALDTEALKTADIIGNGEDGTSVIRTASGTIDADEIRQIAAEIAADVARDAAEKAETDEAGNEKKPKKAKRKKPARTGFDTMAVWYRYYQIHHRH